MKQRLSVSKITECEGEAAETQVWIEFAVQSGYLQRDIGRDLYRSYGNYSATIKIR